MERDVFEGEGSGGLKGIVEVKGKGKGRERKKEYVRMYAPYITPLFKACVSNA